jgi:porin
MKVHKNILKLSNVVALLIAVLWAETGFAELKLPSGERAPNVSLDPFERAREAIRRLPEEPTEPPPQQEPPRRDSSRNVEQPRRTTTAQPATIAADAGETDENGGSVTDAFSWESSLVIDWFAKTAGGVPVADASQDPGSSAMPGLLSLTMELDTGAAGLWKNGLFNTYVYVAFGNSPSEFTGDFHGISNIDAGGGTYTNLYEAWYQHSFPSSNSSVLVGVFDWNSEFYVSEYSNLFLNGAPGMGTIVSVGAGPSNYPQTAFGVRFKVDLNDRTYLMMSALDGVPGPQEKFVDLNFNRVDGVFGSTEIGVHKGEPGEAEGYYKVALGGWYLKQAIEGFTGIEDPALNPGSTVRPGNGGFYLLGETSIGSTLGLYVKYGHADAKINRYSDFYSGGLSYTGLIPGRDEDVIGVAVIQTNQSSEFLAANPNDSDGNPFFTKETVYELTYSTQLTDWLMIQPDFQYVLQPGMDFDNGNAVIVGLRAQIVY